MRTIWLIYDRRTPVEEILEQVADGTVSSHRVCGNAYSANASRHATERVWKITISATRDGA